MKKWLKEIIGRIWWRGCSMGFKIKMGAKAEIGVLEKGRILSRSGRG